MAHVRARWLAIRFTVNVALTAAALPACDANEPRTTPQEAGAPLGDAGTHDAGPARGPTPQGTIEVLGECDADGGLAGTACTQVSVRCPGVADLGASIRITRPSGPARATLLVGSGGSGTAFLEETPQAASLLRELVDAGVVVVSRKWDVPGWFAGDKGMVASSCRYATLLRWVSETARAPDAPYCALGLSGGSYEVGYALARWDGADRLDGALLFAGPAVTRLDTVCPSVATAQWTDTDCPALAEKYGYTPSCGTAITCTSPPNGSGAVVDSAWSPAHPCTDAADPNTSVLANDGIVSAASVLDYPRTKVRFVLGDLDCGVHVLLYYDRITSDRGLSLASNTPHDLFSTIDGVTKMRAALREACVSF
jgi:hypothetical protein